MAARAGPMLAPSPLQRKARWLLFLTHSSFVWTPFPRASPATRLATTNLGSPATMKAKLVRLKALWWPTAPRTETRGRESARAVSFQWLESAFDDVSSA